MENASMEVIQQRTINQDTQPSFASRYESITESSDYGVPLPRQQSSSNSITDTDTIKKIKPTYVSMPKNNNTNDNNNNSARKKKAKKEDRYSLTPSTAEQLTAVTTSTSKTNANVDKIAAEKSTKAIDGDDVDNGDSTYSVTPALTSTLPSNTRRKSGGDAKSRKQQSLTSSGTAYINAADLMTDNSLIESAKTKTGAVVVGATRKKPSSASTTNDASTTSPKLPRTTSPSTPKKKKTMSGAQNQQTKE
jgi:hypothetical protein